MLERFAIHCKSPELECLDAELCIWLSWQGLVPRNHHLHVVKVLAKPLIEVANITSLYVAEGGQFRFLDWDRYDLPMTRRDLL